MPDLIFAHGIRLARVDPAAIEAVGPGGADGFDDDFREPVLEGGSPARRELAEVRLRAQIEPGAFAEFVAVSAGSAPRGDLQATVAFAELRDLSLVDAAGQALVREGDRLVAIENGEGVQIFEPSVPLFVERATPDSWGLGTAGPRLLVLSFRTRPEGVPATLP